MFARGLYQGLPLVDVRTYVHIVDPFVATLSLSISAYQAATRAWINILSYLFYFIYIDMLEYLEYIIVQYFGNSLGNVLWRAEMRFKITAATTGSMRLPVASPQNIKFSNALSSHFYSTSHIYFVYVLTHSVRILCMCVDTLTSNTHSWVDTLTGYKWTCGAHTDKLHMDMQCTHWQAGYTNTPTHMIIFAE